MKFIEKFIILDDSEKIIKVSKYYEDARVEAQFLKEMHPTRHFVILHVLEEF